jgi:hypothetical protein
MSYDTDQIPRPAASSTGFQPSTSTATMSRATDSPFSPTGGNSPRTPLFTFPQPQFGTTPILGPSDAATSESSSEATAALVSGASASPDSGSSLTIPAAGPSEAATSESSSEATAALVSGASASPHSGPSLTIPAAATAASEAVVNGRLHPTPGNPATTPTQSPTHVTPAPSRTKLNIDYDWWVVLFVTFSSFVVTSVYVFALTSVDNRLERWVHLGVSSDLVILIITTEVVGILLIELCSSTLQTIGWWCATSSPPREMSVASLLGISPTTTLTGLFRLFVWSSSRRRALWLWLGLR